MRKVTSLLLVIIISGLWGIVGCYDGDPADGGTGTLSMYMTDAATDNFEAIYVTVDDVHVHMAENSGGNNPPKGGGGSGNPDAADAWKAVASPGKTYNLLELVNGVMAELGTTRLEAGRYTQVRLMLGENPDDTANINGNPHPYPNYVVKEDGSVEKLRVPSGYQSGVKLVHGFEIAAGQTAELVLDFDASRSVVTTGSGTYKLKPTIKVVETLNYPLVKGIVTDASGAPLPNAVVRAQKVDSEGEVQVFTSTLTEGEDGDAGAYQMYLPTGAYYIAAYKGGVVNGQGEAAAFGPACIFLEAGQLDAVYAENDFALELVKTGNIAVEIAFPQASAGAEPVAALSVRRSASCSDSGDLIEIAAKTVSESGTYRFSVPGSRDGVAYTVAASVGDAAAQETVNVVSGLTAPPVSFDFK